MNYFELYGLPVSFTIDESALKRKFYELSKRCHPDFYINESEEKQQEILELSTLTNRAYQVLSDPLKRISYVLEQTGLIIEGEQYQLSPDFLIEMMEVNEALMEMEFEPDPVALEQVTLQVASMERDLFDQLKILTDAFDKSDQQEQNDLLLKIKDIWYRQKYLLRIRESLNKFAVR